MIKTLAFRVLGLVLVGPGVLGSLSYADAGRVGLWHAFETGQHQSMLFLVVGHDQIHCYSRQWEPLGDPVPLPGGRFEVKLTLPGQGLVVSGRFEDGVWRGSWLRPHAQFEIKGEWVARRISSDPDWKPWDFVSRAEEGFIDLSATLRARSGGTPEEFEAFWRERVEGEFYALLTQLLYADDLGNYQEALRKERVRAVYDFASRSPAGSRGDFRALLDRVKARLQEVYPWLSADGVVLFFPSAGQVNYRSFSVWLEEEARPVLLVAADWLWSLPEDERVERLGEALLYFSQPTPVLAMGPDIAKRGIASFLARRLAGSLEPDSADAESEGAEEVSALARTIEKSYWKPLSGAAAQFYKENASGIRKLAERFGGKLARKRSAQEMVNLPVSELIQEFNTFLAEEIARTVPPGSRPNREGSRRPVP